MGEEHVKNFWNVKTAHVRHKRVCMEEVKAEGTKINK